MALEEKARIVNKVRVLRILLVVCSEKAEDDSIDHSLGMGRMQWDVEIGVVWFLQSLVVMWSFL